MVTREKRNNEFQLLLSNTHFALQFRWWPQKVEYTVTLYGRPVAVIRPLSASDAVDHADDEVQKELSEMAELARRIGESWSSPKSALQLLEEMREESQ